MVRLWLTRIAGAGLLLTLLVFPPIISFLPGAAAEVPRADAAEAGGIEDALAWLNRARGAAGAPPVTLDDTLSAAAAAHAQYLVRNEGLPAVMGLSAHDEDLTLPGATPGGKAAAAASNISAHSATVLDAVVGLTGVPLHRAGMLNPKLRRVGVGAAAYAKGGLAVVVDVSRGADWQAPDTARPLVYPAPGQVGVPLQMDGETPDPRNATLGAGQPAGFAITVEPTCGPLGAPARVQLRDDTGADVPVWVVNPGTVLSAAGGTRTVRQVIVLAQRPLEGGTTYSVAIAGQCAAASYALDWSFTTTGRKLPRNARGEYEVRVPQAMGFEAATNWQATYQPSQLAAGIRLVVERDALLPDDAYQRLGPQRLPVQMADGGPLDLRLLRPLRWAQVGGVRVADYADGPQFYAEFQRQQASRWGTPLAPPAVEAGAWLLRFPAGAEMRWMPSATAAVVTQPCGFQLGFAALQSLIPGQVGACTEHEHFNPANGNTEQRTTGGLLVWRKADNWTAFTDGYRTWLTGPEGLQVRLNAERFDWELPAGA